mgnify:CR=1 FL=1
MTGSSAAIRYESLDAIRGVAVMGILAMNIVAFALPTSAYFNPAAGGPPSPGDLATWAFNFVLVDSKMRGLFSILFGASTLLVIESATASGRSAAGTHYMRMAWLLLFGLAHYYFLWFGDILSLYAVCGLLLFLFRNLSIRGLLIWAVAFLALGLAWTAGVWAMFSAAQQGGLPPAAMEGMAEGLTQMQREMGANSPGYAQDIARYTGSYASIVGYRTGEMVAGPLIQMMQAFAETMGLMLIGMALFKARMLTGEWDAARYRRWALICFAISTPVLALLVHFQMAHDFDAIAVFGASLSFSMPFDVLMAVGWAALIMLLIQTRASDAVRARLAATGRMAFTNYLVTTIVMTTIFYGYGLGLFGSVSRAGLYLFCFGMWAAMLLWSQPWLARFHYGPLEWLWRSLSRLSLQPMRRTATA